MIKTTSERLVKAIDFFICWYSSLFMFFCLVIVMPLCASIYLCLEVTCWERADLLALDCGV